MTLTSRTEQRIVIKHCVPVGMTPMDTHIFVYMVKLKPNCVMVFNSFSVSMAQYIKRRCDDNSDCKRSASPKIVTENVMNQYGKR